MQYISIPGEGTQIHVTMQHSDTVNHFADGQQEVIIDEVVKDTKKRFIIQTKHQCQLRKE